jgi:hypothetical protein
MFDTTKQFFRDISTEDVEGRIFCWARLVILLGAITIIGFSGYQLYLAPTLFSIEVYGRTLMEYMIGAAALIFAKGKSGE